MRDDVYRSLLPTLLERYFIGIANDAARDKSVQRMKTGKTNEAIVASVIETLVLRRQGENLIMGLSSAADLLLPHVDTVRARAHLTVCVRKNAIVTSPQQHTCEVLES